MKTRILIVEDEKEIISFLQPELEHEGYSVTAVQDGRSAMECLDTQSFDLVLLDIMLPGISGMEVLRRIRKRSKIPIIMVTARDATFDKVSALDQGADDYLVKPYEIEELLARVRVALRKEAGNKTLKVWNLTLDPAGHRVTVGADRIDLSAKEFDLLQYLLENKGIVLSREMILDRVWGDVYVGDTKAVDVYISHLRTKLDEVYHHAFITTVRGSGYVIRDEDSL